MGQLERKSDVDFIESRVQLFVCVLQWICFRALFLVKACSMVCALFFFGIPRLGTNPTSQRPAEASIDASQVRPRIVGVFLEVAG